MNFIGKGFGRLYEGLPKFKLPDLKWAKSCVYGPLNLLLGYNRTKDSRHRNSKSICDVEST